LKDRIRERENMKNEGADETPNLLVIDNTRYVVCTLPWVEQKTFHKKSARLKNSKSQNIDSSGNLNNIKKKQQP